MVILDLDNTDGIYAQCFVDVTDMILLLKLCNYLQSSGFSSLFIYQMIAVHLILCCNVC